MAAWSLIDSEGLHELLLLLLLPELELLIKFELGSIGLKSELSELIVTFEFYPIKYLKISKRKMQKIFKIDTMYIHTRFPAPFISYFIL